MTTSFRRAGEGDILAILKMVEAFYAGEHIPFDPAIAGRALSQIMGNSALGSVWFVEMEGARLGYFVLTHGFILEFGGRHMVLDEFYIAPEARGCGHGRVALKKAEEICAAEGVNTLRLEADLENERALSIYQRAGFILHERKTMTKHLR